MELSWQEIVLRLVSATILCGAIGIERHWHKKPAGFRTTGLVGLGSAVMTLVGVNAVNGMPGVDPTRIASVVVQGIGFLGAGLIIQSSGAVRGLTTAATLWAVAGIGMAAGFGFWLTAVFATLLVLMLLILFGPLDARIEEESERVEKRKNGFLKNGKGSRTSNGT